MTAREGLPAAYAAALGERINDLHPALRAYFSPIPDGHVGIGEGTFDEVGTSQRWLRPFLRVLEPAGVLYAGQEQRVPFRVHNRPDRGSVVAERTLRFTGKTWIMRDRVTHVGGGHVVDSLGAPARIAALFRVDTKNGALVLTSTRVGVRLGRLRIRVPSAVSPRVQLIERFDDTRQMQHVDARVRLPLLGEIYRYRGYFDYRIVSEGQA